MNRRSNWGSSCRCSRRRSRFCLSFLLSSSLFTFTKWLGNRRALGRRSVRDRFERSATEHGLNQSCLSNDGGAYRATMRMFAGRRSLSANQSVAALNSRSKLVHVRGIRLGGGCLANTNHSSSFRNRLRSINAPVRSSRIIVIRVNVIQTKRASSINRLSL